MKLEQFGDKSWVARSSYDERLIPKEAGFRWNPNQKVWWTDNPEKALILKEYADTKTIDSINNCFVQREKAIEASKKSDSNLIIPVPNGLEYLPFQKAGIEYCNDRKNSLIADEMGLGKTIQAIGFINLNSSLEKILVICPASLKLNWKREMEKWLVGSFSIEIANNIFPKAQIIITNYDIIGKHSKIIKETDWDLLICDESHYLKNPKAKRTQEILGYGEIPPITAKRKIFLTGTPILNRPIELHPLLRSLNVEFAKSWKHYVLRYCDGEQTKYGWDVSGASNTEELGKKLRESIMVRREKFQVLTELPDKIHQLIPVPANGASKIIARENKMWLEYQEENKALKEQISRMKKEGKSDSEEYKIEVDKLRSSSMKAFAEIAKLRHETAIAKIPVVLDCLLNSIEASKYMVVFAHHTDVIDGIVSSLKENKIVTEKIDGSTSLEKRQQIVDDFQAGKIQIVVGSIKACGVGLTLTQASHVVFAELDWTPATIQQAEDRCHRIGQKNSVLIQHIVFDGSIDAMIAKKLVYKEEIIESILQ